MSTDMHEWMCMSKMVGNGDYEKMAMDRRGKTFLFRLQQGLVGCLRGVQRVLQISDMLLAWVC